MAKMKFLCSWAGVIACSLMLLHCGNLTSVSTKSSTISYREPIDPLGKASEAVGRRHSSDYHHSFLGWQVEHDNIVSAQEYGRLAVLESSSPYHRPSSDVDPVCPDRKAAPIAQLSGIISEFTGRNGARCVASHHGPQISVIKAGDIGVYWTGDNWHDNF